VLARDQSEPEQLSTTSVEIIISRDQFPPVFSQSEYRVSIGEAPSVDDTAILKVQASDQDMKVCTV
jgi:hypothetical protein